MRDYARIAAKIRDSIWLCTPDGMSLILDIFNARMSGKLLSDEEIQLRLEMAGDRGNGNDRVTTLNGGSIGVLPIYGPIFGKANMMTELSGATSLEMFKKDFSQMVNDPQIKSIILDIDSPGGTSEMVETTGNLIFSARDVKPIISVANTNAGSAAYWLASQASEFYATPDGVVGSVGAYTVHEDQSVADAHEGIKYTFISAGPYKTEGNPHEPLSQEGKEYRQQVINELYSNFLGAIAKGRGTSVEEVTEKFGGGRMIQAKHAIDAGMVDGIMEFDAVVEHAATMKSPVAREHSFALVGENGPEMLTARFDQETGSFTLSMSNVGMEHSEPGTGQPPTPRDPESDRGAYGSRRPDLPEGFPNNSVDQPNGAKANANEGGNMNEEQLQALYALFGVDSEEALITAVTDMHATSQALSSDVKLAAEELKFQNDFPHMWKKMQEDNAKLRKTEAIAFVESIGMFTKMEGDKQVQTAFGLSALSRDVVNATYLKLADSAYLEDFMACMNAVSGGIVEYGERGSNLTPAGDSKVAVTGDYKEVRKEFAALVATKQQEGLNYKEAITAAAAENPELAEAYRTAKPVIR